MQKHFSVVLQFYQIDWKTHAKLSGNFKPWGFACFIEKVATNFKQVENGPSRRHIQGSK